MFKYGSAYHCYVEGPLFVTAVGAVEDGESMAVSHLSNNLDKLEQTLIEAEISFQHPDLTNPSIRADREHELVNGTIEDLSEGVVVSVIVDSDDVIRAVIFTDPINYMPTIVE